ncbi:MAG: hypothetical protein ACKV19_24905 [Verrucomicrobiales bacterium]
MSSIELAALPPAVAKSLAAGKTVAVKQGRRIVARLEPVASPERRAPSGQRTTVEEWVAQYAANGPRVPDAVDAFIRDRD